MQDEDFDNVETDYDNEHPSHMSFDTNKRVFDFSFIPRWITCLDGV